MMILKIIMIEEQSEIMKVFFSSSHSSDVSVKPSPLNPSCFFFFYTEFNDHFIQML